ncbi:MAG TPA: ferritin [Anaerolineaceae bacterium]
MKQEIQNALNAQIGHEYQNYVLYEQASAYFDDLGMDEAASLMRKQADGELEHARKFTDYVRDAKGKVVIPTIQAQKSDFSSGESVFLAAYEREQETTAKIYAIRDLAWKAGDHATFEMLTWFVNEQVEEENLTEKLLQVVRGFGEKSLYLIEAYLSHKA